MNNATLAALENCPKDSSNYNYFTSFIPLVYGIPTIALNLVFTVLIIRKKALSSVFFYQFIVFGTGNSLYWLTSFIIDKDLCPLFVELFTQPTLTLKVLYLIYCYSIECYFCCSFTIFVWRFATLFRMRRVKFGPKSLRLMVLVLFVVPFSFFPFFINSSVRFGFLQAGSPKILWDLGWPYLSAAAISGVFGAVLCVTILVTSVLIIVFILGKKENSVAERNVMITCLTFAISAASISLYQGSVFYFKFIAMNNDITNRIINYRGVVVDIAALLPSWCLLITSSQVRSSIYEGNSVTAFQAPSTGSH